MLAGTDDHLTWLSPVILNLENMGLTHLESEIRVSKYAHSELNHFNYKSRGNNLIHVCQEKRLKSPFVFSNKYRVTNNKLKLNKRSDV